MVVGVEADPPETLPTDAAAPWAGREPVPDTEVVMQLGNAKVKRNSRWDRREFGFRSSLRVDEGEEYLSMLEGQMTLEEAVPLVNRGDTAGEGDCARVTTGTVLETAGFILVRWPTNTIPNHIAVFQKEEIWDDETTLRFSRCFTEFVWKADGNE